MHPVSTIYKVSDFTQQLFEKIPPENVTLFSCDHVIPDENLLTLIFEKGPTDIPFDFTFKSRNDPKMIEELGKLVTNMCNIIPGGIVIFFPSYQFEEYVHNDWKQHGMYDRIQLKKMIFREPRKASQVEIVLRRYADTIENSRKDNKTGGALLSCVVGGKMSEGINFSDDLGRAVIIVGLPYPNSKNPILQEKISYINQKAKANRITGAQYYDNLCAKAVNQSIGRSIRHINDYATIMLIDQRYKRPQIVSKLPKWISSRLVQTNDFGSGFGKVAQFFARKKATSKK